MRELTLNNGKSKTVTDGKICEILSITPPTLRTHKKNKTLNFKQIEMIADHFNTTLENVYLFLGYKN